jgi:hypothetical protein
MRASGFAARVRVRRPRLGPAAGMKRKDEGYLEVGIPGTLGYLGHIGHARRTCELLGGGLWRGGC